MDKIILNVKHIEKDRFCSPRLKDIDTKEIYVDISLGDAAKNPEKYAKQVGDWNKLNIAGDWSTTSRDGEPCSALSKKVFFNLVDK